MFKTIEEYEARQTEIRSRVQEIDAEYEGLALPDEARSEWDELNVELEKNDEVIEELRARRDRVAEIAGQPAQVERAGRDFQVKRAGSVTDGDIYDLTRYRSMSNSPDAEARLLRDGAMKAVETGSFPHPDATRAKVQDHVASLIDRHSPKDQGELARRILATGSPNYRKAFGKALIGAPLTTDEARALSLTTTAGGYAVPFQLDPTIIPTSNGAVNPLRAISRVETITTNEWKGVSSAGITASYAAEGTEASDNAPTLGQPTATPERAQAFVPYSIEVGGDWAGLQAEMASLLQDAKDQLEATKFTKGAGHGSNEPEGIITGATTTVAAGTAAFTVAHLYALQEALPPRFEPNAKFLAHNAQYNRVRQLDTNGGTNLWVRLADGNPPELIGYPAYKSSAMDSVLTAGSEIMVFGDFSQFLIVDRLGMSVELIPHLFGTTANLPTGQRGLFAIWRNTSDVLVPGAFRVLSTT